MSKLRLTPKQREMLQLMANEDGEEWPICDGWREFWGHEWRLAVALAKKGVFVLDRPLDSKVAEDDDFSGVLQESMAEELRRVIVPVKK